MSSSECNDSLFPRTPQEIRRVREQAKETGLGARPHRTTAEANEALNEFKTVLRKVRLDQPHGMNESMRDQRVHIRSRSYGPDF